MIKHLLIFILAVTSFVTAAQGIKYTTDGDGYYQTEKGSIVKISLPSFTKTTVVAQDKLIPTGQSSALKLRDYELSEDGKKLLIYTNTKKVWRKDTRGDYWMLNIETNNLQQLGKSRPASSLMFAKIAPDGTKAAYVSEHNIYVEDLTNNTIKQITLDGTDRIINGTFDWVYEEEFGCRDGFRWSSDSKSIAYWQIDARKIKNFLLINNTDSIYSFTKPVEYPKVGEDPSACKIGVVNIATAKTVWMKVPGSNVQNYIPRMEWAGNSKEIIIQQLNRKQQESNILLLNAKTGESKTIYNEKDNAWIDIKSRWNHDDPTGWDWINNDNDFLWVSEKDGWNHIYAISKDGKKETLLTKGNFDMIDLEAIDKKNGLVYFSASPNNALQKYLYKVKTDGSTTTPELVSPANLQGTHGYSISPNGAFAQHNFSNIATPPAKEWVSLPDHKNIEKNGKTITPKTDSDGVEFIKIPVDDVVLDGWMIKPTNFDSTKKYPVVFYVYTEPGATTVSDTYGNAGTFLYGGDMAGDGYIQISIDGRGTPAPKGAAWRKSIYKKVGVLNVQDQAAAARQILQWPYVDSSRIAVWGWSGGGSTTLNLMFQYPNIYKTGIAIAPVAYRLSYDNIYEERYMGLDKADYIKASAITYAKNLKGNLLVVHGTGDDNVHYQNTEMLVNELVKYGKQFQMMAYPNRTHGISEGQGTFMHLSKLFTEYLKRNCPAGGR